jgi:hypothetical protein
VISTRLGAAFANCCTISSWRGRFRLSSQSSASQRSSTIVRNVKLAGECASCEHMSEMHRAAPWNLSAGVSRTSGKEWDEANLCHGHELTKRHFERVQLSGLRQRPAWDQPLNKCLQLLDMCNHGCPRK